MVTLVSAGRKWYQLVLQNGDAASAGQVLPVMYRGGPVEQPGVLMCAVQYHQLGGWSSLIAERKPGYVAERRVSTVRWNLKGATGKGPGRSESEPEVAFHIDDPP